MSPSIWLTQRSDGHNWEPWHNKPLHRVRKSETPFDWLSRWVVEGLDSRGRTFSRNHWSRFPWNPTTKAKTWSHNSYSGLLRASEQQDKKHKEEENQPNWLATTIRRSVVNQSSGWQATVIKWSMGMRAGSSSLLQRFLLSTSSTQAWCLLCLLF